VSSLTVPGIRTDEKDKRQGRIRKASRFEEKIRKYRELFLASAIGSGKYYALRTTNNVPLDVRF